MTGDFPEGSLFHWYVPGPNGTCGICAERIRVKKVKP